MAKQSVIDPAAGNPVWTQVPTSPELPPAPLPPGVPGEPPGPDLPDAPIDEPPGPDLPDGDDLPPLGDPPYRPPVRMSPAL